MAESTVIPEFRVDKILDQVLPENTYSGQLNMRFWTNSEGSYRLSFERLEQPRLMRVITFHHEAWGWQVRVPTTEAGLNTLFAAMVQAGAIAAPPVSGRVRVLSAPEWSA
jgi:hypothetical protein